MARFPPKLHDTFWPPLCDFPIVELPFFEGAVPSFGVCPLVGLKKARPFGVLLLKSLSPRLRRADLG